MSEFRMKFEGTDTYVATGDLTMAVNAARALQRPLLIKVRESEINGSVRAR